MKTVFGIDEDFWNQVIMPTMKVGASNQKSLKSLVIVRESKDIKKMALFYQDKLGETWLRNEANTLNKNLELRAVNVVGQEDIFYITSSDNIKTVKRGFIFNQIIFAKV